MTKLYLQGLRERSKELGQIRERIEELESMMYSTHSPSLSGMPHGNGEKKTIEDSIVAHYKLIDRYSALLSSFEREMVLVEDYLVDLKVEERMLIRYRYLDSRYLTWSQICDLLNFSWSQTHRIHDSALRKLSKA